MAALTAVLWRALEKQGLVTAEDLANAGRGVFDQLEAAETPPHAALETMRWSFELFRSAK